MSKPFLIGFSVPQDLNTKEIEFFYNNKLNLNLVKSDNEDMPLAKLCFNYNANDKSLIYSKTLVKQEEDDENYNLTMNNLMLIYKGIESKLVFALVSKTEVRAEEDDEYSEYEQEDYEFWEESKYEDEYNIKLTLKEKHK